MIRKQILNNKIIIRDSEPDILSDNPKRPKSLFYDKGSGDRVLKHSENFILSDIRGKSDVPKLR